MASNRSYEYDLPLLSDDAPGGVMVYYADGDEEIIHVNQYIIDLFECDSVEDFLQLTGGTFKGFVHAYDLDVVEDSITAQVEQHSSFDHIYYRIKTKTGRLVSVEDYGRRIEDPERGSLFTVFVIEMERGGAVDWLTGLPDIQRFHELARMSSTVIAGRGERPAVIALDLIGLKSYNAEFGWAEGDRLLCDFADVIRRHFGSEACSRFGEDHFYAYASAEGLEEKLEKLFADFAETEERKVLPIRTGVYVCDPDDDIVSVGLDRAKIACDLDRVTWQSHAQWYSDELREAAQLRIRVLEYVDQAIAEGWIRPHYQAIVRSATGAVCGEEALARWIDPVYGILSPAQFVPVLEEAGVQYKVDLHIVDRVLADMAVKRSLGVGIVPVSVNISQRDMEVIDVAHEIAERVDAAQVPHRLIRIEFTESAASSNRDALKQQIKALRAAGFEVWMDDFGSGYSSLNFVQEFDFDLIKLDMAFVDNIDKEKGRSIVEGVIRSAMHIGVNTLAEGVETEEQATLLAEAGCSMLQGYYYVKPLPVITIMADCVVDHSIRLEAEDERAYWNKLGMVSLKDTEVSASARSGDDACEAKSGEMGSGEEFPASDHPVGIVERRCGQWRILRANRSFREFLDKVGYLPLSHSGLYAHPIERDIEAEFVRAADRCSRTMRWERIAGRSEAGFAFQFYLKPCASAPEAEAFIVAGVPTMLGSALGSYGDVPVAYAVLRAVLNEEGTQMVNAEYLYANSMYCDLASLKMPDIIGCSFFEVNAQADDVWFPYCYRAAILGETVQTTEYSPEIGHWINFTAAPASVQGCFIVACVIVDDDRRERQEFEWLATHDTLTGLLDRRGIDRAETAFLADNPRGPLAMALLDIDDFKAINDAYGHVVGDEALRALAHAMEQAFPAGSILGRNGGDEFLITLLGEDAADAERLFGAFTEGRYPYGSADAQHAFTVSLGYACFPEQADDFQAIYTLADSALYAAKLVGKATCRKFDPAMNTQYRSQLGFTPRDIAENVPGAVIVHRAGGDGEILFVNDELIEMFACADLAEFMDYTGATFKGMVYPDDRDYARRQIARQVGLDQVGGKAFVNFRIIAKDGTIKRVAENSRLVDVDGVGKVFYVLLIDRDERVVP